MPIKFKIKNWKLAILAFLLFCLFLSLGYWQLSRAKQKEILLKSFAERTLQAPLSIHDLNKSNDLRFHRATLTGSFDNQHTFLLDNKTFHGKVGYEVFTPFNADGITTPILIDRGFIPIGADRKILPSIQHIAGNITITGLLNQPPAYVSLGKITEPGQNHWPMRVEYANLHELSTLLGRSLFPYILNLTPNGPASYALEWQITTISPEKHKGYAVQWFALALTLLILFIVLNRSPENK